MNALGQFVVFHQVADLKVFVGKEARETRRARSLSFERNLHAAVARVTRRFRQALSGFPAALALFLFP